MNKLIERASKAEVVLAKKPTETEIQLQMAVVDIDDTLLSGGRLSRLFWRLSLTFQRIGRRLQKVNSPLLHELDKYETIVILTGRDKGEIQFTRKQLRKAGVRFDKLVCCPRKEMINNWKFSIVNSLVKGNRIVWVDDIFDGGLELDSTKQFSSNVTMVPPSNMNKVDKSSELEWL